MKWVIRLTFAQPVSCSNRLCWPGFCFFLRGMKLLTLAPSFIVSCFKVLCSLIRRQHDSAEFLSVGWLFETAKARKRLFLAFARTASYF